MIAKQFIPADRLVRDAFELARKVYDSGFRPEGLLVLWRGGTPVGIVVHEFLLFKGIETYHLAVKAESYTGIGERVEPRIEQIDVFVKNIRPDAPVLVVDDIFDTGRTLYKVLGMLSPRTRNVKIATLFYRPGAGQVPLKPDYHLRTTDRWIVFPHELMGLTESEIRAKDPAIHRTLFGPGV